VGALMTVRQAVKTGELQCGVVVEKGHPDGVGDQLGMGVDWPGLMIDSTPSSDRLDESTSSRRGHPNKRCGTSPASCNSRQGV
jgi:hypothetical protein